jgi:two-component system, OmpR family, sensor histidine kinase VicK
VVVASPSSSKFIKNSQERTEVNYGIESVIRIVLEFLSQTNNRVDACVDYTRPSLAIDFLALKNAFINTKKRGVKLRYVTEITRDNISYCKLLTTIVDELRHLDGIKGNFYISDTAYIAPATLHEKGKPASQIIFSNVKELVEHQHYVFDSFWSRAIPAEQKIREIEVGVVHYKTRIIDNSDEILKQISSLTVESKELCTCLTPGGMQYSHHYFFDIKKDLLDRQNRGEHKGIRYVTTIDKENLQLAKAYLESGIQIKHVKNLPPMSFGVSDKEIAVTIEKMEGGSVVRSLLTSNEPHYQKHFSSIFEELWRNGVDCNNRIKEIEEGTESTKIEIIENPREAVKLARNLIKSAKQEVLRIYPSLNAFRRQERIGAMDLFREAIVERSVKVRVLIPSDEKQIIKIGKDISLPLKLQRLLDIRSIDKSLQTHMGIIVVDRKDSLIIELRDDTKENYYDAAGLAAYSNSKAIAQSYAAIFESLWKQGELYEQLKAFSMMQKDFINIAAHELRTPIQPILGLSEVVSQKVHGEERGYMDVIIRNAKRLHRLTENILDVTKIESQSLRFKNEKLNLTEVIMNVLSEYESQVKKTQNVTITSTAKEDFIVEGDKGRLAQVLSNLLNNAIKFTQEGTIVILAKNINNDNATIVSVKDTGIGISTEIFPRLFEKFVTSKSFEGTGLGLYISKRIIEAHGGSIWAENNSDGKGATFSFTLPIIRNTELGDKQE